MSVTTPAPRQGDPCPQCGGAFKLARQLSEKEYAQYIDSEQPRHVLGFVDTAAPDFIGEHGPLAKCSDCGYLTRYAPGDEPAPAAAKASRRGSSTAE